MTNLTKNIRLSYLLVFLNNSFFWYAPWLLFLLNYIDFTQAVILQSIGLLTSVIVEIPTGAISDIFGKKKTLLLAFLLAAIGEISMAFSSEFMYFVLAYIVLNVGYSFYSGTMEAFTYDTLLSNNKEKSYSKVVSRTNAFMNAGIALSSIIGGFMFGIWIGLPFLATGIFKLLGFCVALFLDEPKIDSVKFSFKNFLIQSKNGFIHIFEKKMLLVSILILTFGVFHVVTYEILDDIAVIDFGYNAQQIGILYAALVICSIPSSLLYEKIEKIISPIYLIFIGIFIVILNYIFSPWISVYVWSALFFIRVVYSPIRDSAISQIVNENTPSNIRATTISTYVLLKRIPFVLFAAPLGILITTLGVRNFASIFSIILLALVIPQIFLIWRYKKS